MISIARWLVPIAVAGLVAACGTATSSAGAGQASGARSGSASGAVSGSASGAPSPAASSKPPAGAATAPRGTAVVTGQVTAGPVTPTSQAGTPNSRPMAGVRVEAMRGAVVAAVTHTGKNGHYKLTLKPGLYVITVQVQGLPAHGPTSKTVIVSAGGRQAVSFAVDTGVR